MVAEAVVLAVTYTTGIVGVGTGSADRIIFMSKVWAPARAAQAARAAKVRMLKVVTRFASVKVEVDDGARGL